MDGNLRKLLRKKILYSYFNIALDYMNEVFKVLILLMGVLVFDISNIHLMIILVGLCLALDFTINCFRHFNKNVLYPQRIFNFFLAASLTIYVLKNLNEVFHYVEIYSLFLMLFYVLKVLTLSKIEDLYSNIKEFNTPVHELGHFISNEEFKMFKPILINLMPDANSSGRIQLERSIDIEVNADNFISFLMSGHIASQYLLYNHRPNIDEIINIVNLELAYIILSDNDKQNIIQMLKNKIRVYRIMESTLNLIKKQKNKIILLAGKIYGKDQILCKDLIVD
jgi:hypothetical protein